MFQIHNATKLSDTAILEFNTTLSGLNESNFDTLKSGLTKAVADTLAVEKSRLSLKLKSRTVSRSTTVYHMEVSIKVSSVTIQKQLTTKIRSSEVFMGDLNTEIHKNAELKVVNVTAIDVPVTVNVGKSMLATSTHINNDFSF